MEKSTLAQKKEVLSQLQQENAISLKELEKNSQVQAYLQEQKRQVKLQQYAKEFEQLEEGYDGTIFQTEECIEKKQYNLDEIVAMIIEMKVINNMECKTSIEEVNAYINHAKTILHDRKYYEQDRPIRKLLDLEIYPNPQDYYQLQCLPTKFDHESWEKLPMSSYIKYDCTSTEFKLKKLYPSILSAQMFNARETEAFCNKTAHQLLGINISDSNLKKLIKEVSNE